MKPTLTDSGHVILNFTEEELRCWPPFAKPEEVRDKLWQLFWEKVAPKDNGCLEWKNAKGKYGHGYCTADDGKSRLAHRTLYQWLFGLVPDDLALDHLCCNASCVNPYHLEPVTPAENSRRALLGKRRPIRTICSNGHPLTPANVYINDGRFVCKQCTRETNRAWREKNPGRANLTSQVWATSHHGYQRDYQREYNRLKHLWRDVHPDAPFALEAARAEFGSDWVGIRG